MQELELWMKDLLRTGLMHVASSQRGSIYEMARRMVDAQASGVAQRLYEIYEIDYNAEGWKELLLDRLSRLYLLISAYRRIETLSEDWQVELRTMVGIPQAQDEVLAGEGVEDDWLVLYTEERSTGDNRTEVAHLYGLQSGRYAVRLTFIVPGRPSMELSLMEGVVYRAKLFFIRECSTAEPWYRMPPIQRRPLSLRALAVSRREWHTIESGWGRTPSPSTPLSVSGR